MKVTKSKKSKVPTIDVNNFRQVRNAAVSFRTTEDHVRQAVAAVGNVIADVRLYFNSNHNPIHRPARGLRL